MKNLPNIRSFILNVEDEEAKEAYIQAIADMSPDDTSGDIKVVAMNIYNHLTSKGLVHLANLVSRWYRNVQSYLTVRNEPVNWF